MKMQQKYSKSYLLKQISVYFLLNTVIGTVIALFLSTVMEYPFFEIFIISQIITHIESFLVTVSGHIVGYLLKGKSIFIEIPVAIICSMIAATLGLKVISLIIGDHIFTDFLLPILVMLTASVTITILFIKLRVSKLNIESELIRIKEKRKSNKKSYLSIKVVDKPLLIECNEIVYLSSSGKKTIIHTEDKDYETSQLLKEIEEKLPADGFIRIHKQFVINLKYISSLRYYIGGRYILYLNDEEDNNLPVGRKYAPVLKEKLKDTGID